MQENNHEPKISIEIPGYSGDGGALITTIIPTYRRPKLLRRAIKSVLNQTYPHFQVCVYDNASCDDTASAVREFAKTDLRINYYCHKENIGAARNFAFGWKNVDTPFFSFLSDDDILLPEFFADALFGFTQYPDSIYSSLLTIRMDEKGHIIRASGLDLKAGFYPAGKGLFAMLRYGSPEWSATLFRKRVTEEVEFDFEGKMGSDKIFQYRIAARYPGVFSKKPRAILVSHSGCFSHIESKKVDAEKWRLWMIEIKESLCKDFCIPQEIRKRINDTYGKFNRDIPPISYAIKCVLDGFFSEAYRISNIFLKERMFLQGKLLLFFTKACERCPRAHSYMKLSKKVHTMIKRKNITTTKIINKKYGWCKTYLENLSKLDGKPYS